MIGAVIGVGRTLARNRRGERHRASAFEQQHDRLVPGEGEDEAALGQPLFGDRHDPRTEIDALAHAQPLRIADKGLPAAKVDALVQRRADFATSATPLEMRRDESRVVQEEAVAGAPPLRQGGLHTLSTNPAIEHNYTTKDTSMICTTTKSKMQHK